MTHIPVLLELVVGQRSDDTHRPISLAEADSIAALAQQVGVTALRLLDGAPGGHTLDPTVVGAYLAGRHGDIGYLADIPTTRNAPYNVARRVLSADRATAGRFGVALRAGGGDEISDATVPDPTATDPGQRWTEYAEVLVRLWESFPRRALIGDQERAVVADDTLIRPIAHEGRFYRVAGPLDGPSSVQGRPVLLAADLNVLDLVAVAPWVDAVVVERERAADADAALTAALRQGGRARSDVALIGRTAIPAGDDRLSSEDLATWVNEAALDGVALVPLGGAEQVTALLHALGRELGSAQGRTLRARLGLGESVEAAA